MIEDNNCPAIVPPTSTAYGTIEPPGPGRSVPFRTTTNQPKLMTAHATAPSTGVPSTRLVPKTNNASVSPESAPTPREPSRHALLTLAALAAMNAVTTPEITTAGILTTAVATPRSVSVSPASSAPNRVPGPMDPHGPITMPINTMSADW